MKFGNSKRVGFLKEQISKIKDHLASSGSYFTPEQRIIIASEASNCLGFVSSSRQLEADPNTNAELPNELKKAVHKIMNFQSECTADWYKKLVSYAASYAGVSTLDEQEGAAMECIGVCATSAALVILQLGLNESTEFSKASTEHPVSLQHKFRARNFSEKITRNSATGWAPFVIKKDLTSGMTGIFQITGRGIATAGDKAFSGTLPFKSLSIVLGEYNHACELAAALYVPLKEVKNFSIQTPGGLNRVQVESVAAAYTGSRACDF